MIKAGIYNFFSSLDGLEILEFKVRKFYADILGITAFTSTMWNTSFAASLLLLGNVSAGLVGNVGDLVRRVESAEMGMKRYVDRLIEPIERRQSTTTMNITEWDAQTMAACTSALEMLNGKASNDAGMAVCYNLPFLDNSTGVFQADLRLFMISAPTGQFANIPTQNISVSLSYVGATVSPLNSSMIGRRSQTLSLNSWPRDALERRQSAVPTMQQAYAFVGQVNKDLVGTSTQM